MSRSAGVALLLAATATLAGMPVWAHGSGASLEVAPDTVTAGGTIVVVGENLEPNDTRVLVLTGADMTLDFGEVTTDGEGMFSKEITIPAHLPGAVYQVQAIGDEVVGVSLNVVAAAGMASAAPIAATEPAPRQRGGFELAILLAIGALAAGLGVLLVMRAERVGRQGA
jgi:hypothetical protein